MTMVSSLRQTSLPRISAGAASAMYMGERPEAMPIASPPMMRHATNVQKTWAEPVPRGRDHKHRGCDHQGTLAAERFAEQAGTECADETSDERAAHCPAGLHGASDAEVRFVERFSAADYDPVIPKEEAT